VKPARDFFFKKFTVSQEKSIHKVGTDGVLLGAWCSVDQVCSVLDIGTGTGVIALMIAQRTDNQVVVDAVELQEEDANEAGSNFKRSPWGNRLHVHNIDIQNFSPGRTYDLIVTNPPFFVKSWLPPDSRRSTVRHTGSLAFDALLTIVKILLNEHGKFSIILPTAEGTQFIDKAALAGLFCIRMCEFRTRLHKPVERLLLEFGFHSTEVKIEKLLLYVEGQTWSEDYRRLTADFYLDR
jgi:tRNA1Val (adenine37-N6)-methyltransferase